jgi:hypothetical protein
MIIWTCVQEGALNPIRCGSHYYVYVCMCYVRVLSLLARALCFVCIAVEAVAVRSRLFDLIYTYYSTWCVIREDPLRSRSAG